MRVFIQDDQGEMLVSFDKGRMYVHKPANLEALGFYLFQLMWKTMEQGGGASYGGPLGQPTNTNLPADLDLGTP